MDDYGWALAVIIVGLGFLLFGQRVFAALMFGGVALYASYKMLGINKERLD